MPRTRWTLKDESDAFFGYMEKIEAETIADRIGKSVDSVKMKYGNILYLLTDGEKGLSHYNENSKMLYDIYMLGQRDAHGAFFGGTIDPESGAHIWESKERGE